MIGPFLFFAVRRFSFLMGVLLFALSGLYSQEQELSFRATAGFRQESGGELFARVGDPRTKRWVAVFERELAPGWYVVRGEYRTDGIGTMGQLILDVAGNQIVRQWQSISASMDWAPLTIYFKVKEESLPSIQLSPPKDIAEDAVLRLRNLTLAPFEMTPGNNLVVNGDFEIGELGSVPPGWNWQYSGKSGDYSLVPNETFRSGSLSLKMGGEDDDYNLASSKMPLPTEGTYTFSFWGKSEVPGTVLNLFLIGDKYEWGPRKSFRLSSEWKEYRLTAECPESLENPFCYARLRIQGGGEAIIEDVRMVWNPPEEVSARPIDLYRQLYLGSDNLVWNPGFELGMNGWMYDFFGYKSDYGEVSPGIVSGAGVDGSSAMRLAQNHSLISGSIPLEEGRRYTLSASVKALRENANLRMFLIDPGWKIFQESFDSLPLDKWKRVSFSVVWDKDSLRDKFYVRFDGDEVLIDNVQLEEGPLTAFDPGMIQAGFVTESNNVFYSKGGAPSFRLRVLFVQKSKDDVWSRIEVRDAWGKTVDSRDVEVNPAEGLVDVPIDLPHDRFGVFEVEARLVDSSGRLLVRCESRYAVVKKPEADDKPIGIFSAEIGSPTLPKWLLMQELPIWQALGVHSSRAFFKTEDQARLLPEAELMESVKERLQIQLDGGQTSILLCLSSLPGPIREKVLASDDLDENSLEGFREFIRGMVEPLQDEVAYWEILNEPNIWRFREGPERGRKSMPAGKYVQLLQVAFDTIKEINPNLQVVGVCLNGADFPYLQEFLDAGGAEYMDIFSYHSYRTSPDIPDVYEDLVRFREMLSNAGFEGPMLNTEQYFAADKFIMRGADAETKRGYYSPGSGELEAAGKTIRNYVYHAALEIPYYAFASNSSLFRFGGYDRYYLYYAFGAFNAAHHFLEEAGKGELLELGSALRGFAFPDANGGPLVVLSTRGDIGQIGRIRFENGNVLCFDEMGNEVSRGSSQKDLPLSPLPIYLRFPAGSSAEEISLFLKDADILGLGEPYSVEASLKGRNALSVKVSNRLNKETKGKVRLGDLSDSWTFFSVEREFESLEPGESVTIDFEGDLEIRSGDNYEFSVIVDSGDGVFSRRKLSLSPILVPRVEGIVADGDLTDWNGADWHRLGSSNQTIFEESNDASESTDLRARYAIGWSPEYVAFAILVDDEAYHPPSSPESAWGYDSVQLYFDQLNNAPGGGDFYDGDDVAYAISSIEGEGIAWLEKNSEGRYVGEANEATGIDREVRVDVSRRDDGKIVYEVLIPHSCLPMTKLEGGEVFGFSMLINDNDGSGRTHGLTLTPAGTQPFERPYLYKDICLIDE